MLNRFVSSGTVRPCRDAGVHPLLTLNSLFYSSSSSSSSSSCRADPLQTFADQLRLTRWYAPSIRLIEYIKTFQGRWGTCIIDSLFATLLLLLLLDSARRVHWAGAKRLQYVHHWLSIHCFSCSSSSCASRSDQFRTFADQLGLTRWYAPSIHLVDYIKTLQGRWGTCIIDSQLTALLLLLDSARRVHQDGAMTLGYV